MTTRAEKAKLRLELGALAPPIGDQLKKQKLTVDPGILEVWEVCRRGILTCYIQGFISRNDLDLVFKRLVRDINRNLKLHAERAPVELDV